MNTRPTAHLSPSQSKAVKLLLNKEDVTITTTTLWHMLEILSTIDLDHTKISISNECLDEATPYIYQNTSEQQLNQSNILEYYNTSFTKLSEVHNIYKAQENTLIRERTRLIKTLDLLHTSDLRVDERLFHHYFALASKHSSDEWITQLYNHRKTWSKYEEIDPFHTDIYTKNGQEMDRIISDLLTVYEDLDLLCTKYNTGLQEVTRSAGLENGPLLERYLHSLNPLNCDNARLSQAKSELDLLIIKLKHLSTLTINLEVKPMSYTKQLDLLKNVSDSVAYALNWQEEQAEYMQWRRFIVTLDPDGLILWNILHPYPSQDAIETVRLLEYNRWKQENLDNGLPRDTELENHILNAYGEWSSSPIIPMDAIVGKTHSNYILQKTDDKYLLTPTLAKSDYSIQVKDKSFYDISLTHTLTHRDKYSQSKRIAMALNSSAVPFRIYQTRGHNLISCLTDTDSIHLESLLAHQGIKQIEGANMTDQLVESMVTEDREAYLILYDRLINPFDTAHILWQKQCIQALEDAGYKIISIDTIHLLDGISIPDILKDSLITTDRIQMIDV